jgi:SpoVK/Ycf46/Vps4 family AAA+-type ATPase
LDAEGNNLSMGVLAQCAIALCVSALSGAMAELGREEREEPDAERPIGLGDARRKIRRAVLAPCAGLGRGAHPLFRPCNGVLLYGPPGTGKTLLARWTASAMCAAGGAYIVAEPATIQSKWYGETARILRDLFDAAIASEPSVLFFDEIDGMLCGRSSSDSAADRELKTCLLSEMSRLERSDARVVLIAATNRPGDLDAALSRRLALKIFVGLPSARVRARALRRFLRVRDDCSWFGPVSEGMSCSDIRELAKGAVATAHERTGRGGLGVGRRDVLEALAAVEGR